MGTHEEGTSFENKLAHFVEGLSGLDYTDAIWFLTEVKRAAEESTQLSRANAELRAALGAFINAHNTAVKALYEDGTQCDCPYCKRARAALNASEPTKKAATR